VKRLVLVLALAACGHDHHVDADAPLPPPDGPVTPSTLTAYARSVVHHTNDCAAAAVREFATPPDPDFASTRRPTRRCSRSPIQDIHRSHVRACTCRNGVK
jgi:hypothetical protein